MRVCGQEFSLDILERLRELVASVPEISRRALSRRVCEWLDWRTPAGAWQEGGCRKALAQLAQRQVVELPRAAAPFAPRRQPDLEVAEVSVCASLEALGAIELVAVGASRSPNAQRWRVLMERHHYLGDKPLCGAQLRYLIRSEHYGWLGGLAFTSASWALHKRDTYIGWEEAARRHNLHRIVANARFLIVPGVEVPNLASHVLGMASRRLPADWEARYGTRPLLLETFVDPTRFTGGCYRAANWIDVGATSGRRDGVEKRIFLYPLAARWKAQLCAAPALRLAPPPRPEAPANWAAEEFASVRWYDGRLKERLCAIAQDFYHHSQASIPEACGARARTVAAYRFFKNAKVNMQVILTPHIESTIERIRQHRVVLAPQDTTTLNYSHHPATDGLGPVNTQRDQSTGLLLHDTLAFSVEGTPLGILDAQCWARDADDKGKSQKRKDLPIEKKESMKWLKSFARLAEIQALCPQTQLVSMGDREADVFDLFALAARDAAGPKLLVRAERTRARRVEDEALWDFMSRQALAGELTLQLPRRGKRSARQAQLTLRFSEVTLQAPKNSALPSVGAWAVHLLEGAAADDGEPIEWMLLTTVPVTTFAEAVERTEWYAARWRIEVFHRTLKSGCRIKDRQLGSATRLQACLGVDMVVAWRIYHLAMLGREMPDHPCTAFFEEVEWKALYCYHHQTTLTPAEPPSMAEATRMLGAIGGHLGRRRDGPPGPQVLWRALQLLDTATQMYVLFTRSAPPTTWRSYPDGYLPPSQSP
ncbi:IS4 family transposase [Candidatus Accumulibacter sp. ACC003]|uniref:IS4 family transposase n=1 Tax=Candidatus Accumulibacter sp. ACC003 TaxID=2823334 RepID=UPI0025C36B6D|nr:IS4 family transposase [Candidatus Accumulibacter sp. ACC003]